MLKVKNGTHRQSPASVSDYTQRHSLGGLFPYKTAKLVLILSHRTWSCGQQEGETFGKDCFVLLFPWVQTTNINIKLYFPSFSSSSSFLVKCWQTSWLKRQTSLSSLQTLEMKSLPGYLCLASLGWKIGYSSEERGWSNSHVKEPYIQIILSMKGETSKISNSSFKNKNVWWTGRALLRLWIHLSSINSLFSNHTEYIGMNIP